MEERTTVARPYAEAAYAQARQENRVEEWASATELLSMIVSDSAVAVRLNDPRVSSQQLTELVIGIDSDVFSGTTENFVKVLQENGRLGYAPEISSIFHQLKAEDENSLDVEVISAYSLDAASEDAMASAIKKKMGKEIQMTTKVDQSLIGGVIVRAGDQVIDSSLRGRMNQLSNELQG